MESMGVGVVSRRWVWLVGGIYGCGYFVLSLFCGSIPTSLFILKMFFRSCLCNFHAI